jgi:hypothetical protein
MHIDFNKLFDAERRADLDREGYAVAPLQIGTVTMHVVAVRAVLNDDDDLIEYASTLSGADEDATNILSLMGDCSGPPQLHEYNGHTYLLGAFPYAN